MSRFELLLVTADWDQLQAEAESPARVSFLHPGGHSFRLTITRCRPNPPTAACTLSDRTRPKPLGCHSSACPACSRHPAWRDLPTTTVGGMPIRCWLERQRDSKRLWDRSLQQKDIPGRVLPPRAPFGRRNLGRSPTLGYPRSS